MAKKNYNISRRDLLKALSTTPLLGAFGFGFFNSHSVKRAPGQMPVTDFRGVEKVRFPKFGQPAASDKIRVGIIGVGARGEGLLRGAGFAHPEWIEEKKKAALENPQNTNLKDFLNQEDLNIEITAVCDLFSKRNDRGAEIARCETRPGGTRKLTSEVKKYTNYRDLLNDSNVNAVIIATSDQWHAQVSIDAAKAGKHIYQEKCFSRTAEEAVKLYDTLAEENVVYQLGHQNHQIESHLIAQNIIDRGLLGKLTLIQGSTRRNRPGHIQFDPMATAKTVDWETFQEPCEEKHPFDLKRYFWWRHYFDYSTGQFGDLLSHEFSAINQIARIGIPQQVMSTGGIWLYGDDGRETPDTITASFNYPDKKLSLNYNLSMGSTQAGGRFFIGKDASMEVEKDIFVKLEKESERYMNVTGNDDFNPEKPSFSFVSGEGVDAVTTATEKYFSRKGLYYTYRDGKLVDSTHLHIAEWLNCIRYGGTPSCNKELGFEEAIACIMASDSYRQKRAVNWDPVNRKIV